MDLLLHDLRFALRSLRRRPGFAAVAIVTLALGVGATTAIFSVVNGVVLRPLPYPDADRIVDVSRVDRTQPRNEEGSSVSPVDIDDWDQSSKTLGAMAEYRESRLTLTANGSAELVQGGVVTSDFFSVFGSAPVVGRTFAREEARLNGPNVAVVSYGFAQERLGGTASAPGKMLELGGEAYEVVGVAPRGFDYPSHARIWLPLQNDREHCGRGCVYMNAAARLAPGATIEEAQKEMSAIAARIEQAYPGSNKNVGVRVRRLQDVVVGSARDALGVLFAAVVLVLLIASANVANLLLARGAARRQEVALRASLGADRKRLVSQLLTESLVLALVGGAAGVGLAWLGVDALRALSPGNIPRLEEVTVSGATLLFALGLVVATSLLSGLAPAISLARSPLVDALRQGGRGSDGASGRRSGRAGLLVAEVGLSLVLLVGAGLLLRSFANLSSVEPGYRTERLATFGINLPSAYDDNPDRAARFWVDLQRELEAIPGTQSVGEVVGLPLSRTTIFSSFRRMDQPPPEPGDEPTSLLRFVNPDYFAAMAIPLVHGRDLEATDRWGSVPVAVVSRAAAEKFWPGMDPIGQQIHVGVGVGYPHEEPYRIIGIVGDIRSLRLERPPEPEIYLPIAQTAPSFGSVVIRTTGSTSAALLAAREALHRLEPGAPIRDPETMQGLIADDLARPRFMLLLVGLFAVLAAVLAGVGIYGVVAYLVSRRTREIGVRMALGATRSGVVGLVVRQGLAPAAAGVALGVAASLWSAGLLRAELYGIAPQDPFTMIAAAVLLLAVTLLACLVPAGRAARIPPATALRSE